MFQLFPFMKITKLGDTKRSREMEFHGLRFMQVLQSVVSAIEHPATIDPLCDNLGRVHGRLADSRGFKAHHWGVFIECTLFHFRRILAAAPSFSNISTLDRAIIVWRTVLRVLIKRMKVGLNSDLKNRQANRDAEDVPSTSERSSPVTDVVLQMPHALTLPSINGNDNDSVCHMAKHYSSGLFRPFRNLARRRITGRHAEATPSLHRHN
ncbi:Globin family and Globin domain and Globin structural domain-containing protein [Trichostrongylus colubriformis]|uniref:Globin family and Globin domain and Globin structural domain-containing protein n=1 Tax=Trichostrongylus colubriformis TaxID=6319 RepID=A0AAN8IGE2_TRICO